MASRRPPREGVCGAPSAPTALRQVPALHRAVPWRRGAVNLDLGGGPYDLATEHLARHGVTNVVVDPGWQSPAELARAMRRVTDGRVSTVTLANTLNVIRDAEARGRALQLAANALGPGGVLYVSVHEGDGTSRGRSTSRGWQANRPLRSYLSEVRRWFGDVTLKGKRIEARRPARASAPTFRCAASTAPNGAPRAAAAGDTRALQERVVELLLERVGARVAMEASRPSAREDVAFVRLCAPGRAWSLVLVGDAATLLTMTGATAPSEVGAWGLRAESPEAVARRVAEAVAPGHGEPAGARNANAW